MYGSNSAFLKSAYFAVNGFDLSIDQFNRCAMQQEEEFLFYRKLCSIGTVLFEVQASCFTSIRSHAYNTMREQRLTDSKYQEEIIRGERF